jgi:hypothetical protein
MHSIVTSVFGAILFYFLIPGVLVRLPPKSSNFRVAVFHALLFGLIFYLTHRIVYKCFSPKWRFEGMETTTPAATTKSAPAATTTVPTTTVPIQHFAVKEGAQPKK